MQAKSGTGKTLVFATIVLENFRKDVKAPQSLIITPTRELAVQIEQILELLGTESRGNCEDWNAFFWTIDRIDFSYRFSKAFK